MAYDSTDGSISMNESTISQKMIVSIKTALLYKAIPIVLIAVIMGGLFTTDKAPYFLMHEIVQVSLRHGFLVLALLMPIRAGMGLNFGIVIGAIAGQLGVIMAINQGYMGLQSFLIAIAFATPLALLFGFMEGQVLNRARGYEMIASLFLSYFANGIYQFVLLFLLGSAIPFKSEELLLPGGTGLRNTIDLSANLGGAIDDLFGGMLQVPIFIVLFIMGIAVLLRNAYRSTYGLNRNSEITDRRHLKKQSILALFLCLISVLVMYIDVLPGNWSQIATVRFPLSTGALLLVFVAFNTLMTQTKFGKAFQSICTEPENEGLVAGRTDKQRLAAIMVSIVLAAWGQIIYLQSSGILITYGSHMGVGTLAAVALLMGGASIRRATAMQALLGVLLLHSFVLLAPALLESVAGGGNIFEVFRMLVLNGVILYAFIQAGKGRGENMA